MARAEISAEVELPAICIKTGRPATDTFTGRITRPRAGPLSSAISCAVAWVWPLAFCFCFVGPILLVYPWGSPIELPVCRSALWRLELYRYATWFLLVGGVLAAIVPGAVSQDWACTGGLGIMVGVLVSLAAYLPAIAYKLYVPSGKLHEDVAAGRQYTVLDGVHPAFATAIIDQRHSRMPIASADSGRDVLPARRTHVEIIIAALVVSLAVIALVTWLVFSITGDSISACQLRVSSQ